MTGYYMTQMLTVFMGFFAMMNPIANIPIFLGITEGSNRKATARIALRAVILAFIITSAFAIAGKLIFELFGLTLPAFRIAGGILVFMIGMNMLQGKQSRVHHPRSAEESSADDSELDVAIFPLAMPILAGPGTLTTAMNFSAQGGVEAMLITIFTFMLLCALTYLVFVFGERLASFTGPVAISVITRMMGLILAVIGTQMAIVGLQEAFPVLVLTANS